jgi:hypothetical protein
LLFDIGCAHAFISFVCLLFVYARCQVSLFLTDALQAQDGSMIHSHVGRLPIGSEVPGTIRYFDPNTPGKILREEKIKLPNSEHTLPPAVGVDITKPGRPCELGQNLYAKDRRKKGAAAAAAAAGGAAGAAAAAAAATAAAQAKSASKSASAGPSAAFEPDEAGKKAAKSELNLLAQMIGGGGGGAGGKEGEKFSIVNLFPDTSLTSDGSGGGSDADPFITFDADSHDARAAALSKRFAGMDVKAGSSSTQDDDLLDLMDAGGQNQYDD